MQIIETPENIPPLTGPISLAIGNFDGVHPGHLYLISELKKRGLPAIITFRNHPAHVLYPEHFFAEHLRAARQPFIEKGRFLTHVSVYGPPPLLSSLEEKLHLLESAGVELVILLSFTPDMALITYDAFLKNVKKHLPFQTFIAGKGDTFGFQRQGTEERVKALESELNFEAIYIEKLKFQGKTISSTRIRQLIASGQIADAQTLINTRF